MPPDVDYYVPTAVLGTSVTAAPQSVHQETTTNLAVNGTWRPEFETEFSPIFDVFVFADVAMELYAEVRQSSTGTYRRLPGVWNVTANQLFSLTNLRLPGTQVRFTLTATGGATATLDAQIYNRSQ